MSAKHWGTQQLVEQVRWDDFLVCKEKDSPPLLWTAQDITTVRDDTILLVPMLIKLFWQIGPKILHKTTSPGLQYNILINPFFVERL